MSQLKKFSTVICAALPEMMAVKAQQLSDLFVMVD